MRLDFAEFEATAAGQRLFNVSSNGVPVLTNYDIFATAGGRDKAVAQSFTATADSNGQISITFAYGNNYALINGIQLLSGNTVLQAINCGLAAGSTLTINPSTFSNQGTLQVSNGATLNVSGLTGNVGTATLSDSGSQLTLDGTNYVIDQGLTVAADQTLTLNGTWSNGSTLTVQEGTLNLGGTFTLADLGTVVRTGGTVNVTGTLDNTGKTLALDGTTGSWNLWGGTLLGGGYTASGGAELFFTNQGGTLDGVTAASDLDLASNSGANVSVLDGLTLDNSTIYIGDAAGATYGQMYFDATESLGTVPGTTGTVVFGKNGSNALYETANPGGTLTLGAGITVRGSNGRLGGYYGGDGIVNLGTMSADDSGGIVPGYVYDTDFSGGNSWISATADTIDTSGVTAPAPAAVYQTAREGYGFTYTLSGLTAATSYTVRLDFAEFEATAAGQRLFNVSSNGVPVLTNYDIFATAGGRDKAVAQSFTATADSNGQISITFAYGNNYALINGIQLLSGNTVLQAINCGLAAGSTLTINPSTFSNQGTLQVSNGATLNVSGLTGNVGTATLSDSGSQLTLDGTNYVIDQGLTVAADQTLTLNGTWSNGSTLTVQEGTLNLGGTFTLADLGTVVRTGGTVNVTGTLDNTGKTLALDGTTGSWNLWGGTLLGGGYTASGGAELFFTNQGGTLDGVTAASDLDLASNSGANVSVLDGLTLDNSTIYIGDAAGATYGQMYFDATESLGTVPGTTGTVVFGKNGSNALYETANPGGTLTLGAGITVRGSNGRLGGYYGGDGIVNLGTMSADDSGGIVPGYVYDTDFSGGNSWISATADTIDTSGVTAPAPAAVYQTAREGYGFTYTLSGLTAATSYTVRLDFAEFEATAAGQRLFNVSSNGVPVLTNYDIFATAGGRDKAVAQSFTATADSNGQISITFAYGNNYALINGIQLLSGNTVLQAINCGLAAGSTLTINPSTFSNQGTLQVSNGATLNVSGLTGNVGTATLSDSGSQLTLDGTNYVIDQGLTVAADQTLTLNGTWSNGSTLTVQEGTLNLGGTFTLADLGTVVRTGGTVNVTGTLDNTGKTLALDGTTGSWNLWGGTLLGGGYTASGGAELFFTNQGGTLDGVTAASDLDLASNSGANVSVLDGLTLDNSTIYIGDAAGATYGQMYFDATESLGTVPGTTGTVVFGKNGSNARLRDGESGRHADARGWDHGARQQRQVGRLLWRGRNRQPGLS